MHTCSQDQREIAGATAFPPWVDMVCITAVIPGIGFAVHREDPFFIETGFPWAALAPMLVGLHHGFGYGLASGLCLVGALGGLWYASGQALGTLPVAFCVGLLLVGMIAGEVRDMWARRWHGLDARCRYQQARFEQFAREHQLLNASHTKLEQRLAGARASFRCAATALHDAIAMIQGDDDVVFADAAERILAVFAEYGGVHLAAVYRVTGTSTPVAAAAPAARLGDPPSVSCDNPLLVEALRTGHTVAMTSDHELDGEGVVAVVPLVDVEGRIWGAVTISDLPFVDFHSKTLDLLTVLGGYVGDAFNTLKRVGGEPHERYEAFVMQLKRCLLDARRSALPATLITLRAAHRADFTALVDLMRTQARGLDALWWNADSDTEAYVLLPFTDAEGGMNYIERLQALFAERQGLAPEDTGMTAQWRLLDAKECAEAILATLAPTSNGPAAVDADRLYGIAR